MPTEPMTGAIPGLALEARLWLLLSPALPIGGYSFSHGLESACRAGLVHDSHSAARWLLELGRSMLGSVDLPLLDRLLDAAARADGAAFARWNDELLAQRESAELLREDEAQGAALARLLPALAVTPPVPLPRPMSLAAAYAPVAMSWRLEPARALAGYAWIWFEQQVAAATRIVPLGHSDALALLLQIADQLDALVDGAQQIEDDEIGAAAPGLAVLSSAHEQQPARQFRS